MWCYRHLKTIAILIAASSASVFAFVSYSFSTISRECNVCEKSVTLLRAGDKIKAGTGKRAESKRARSTKHSSLQETWRIFGVEVHPDNLNPPQNTPNNNLPIEKRYLEPAVLEALFKRLKLNPLPTTTIISNGSPFQLPNGILDIRVVRRSIDARSKKRRADGEFGPRFVYVMDVDVVASIKRIQLRNQPGRVELLHSISESERPEHLQASDIPSSEGDSKKQVIIVGAGPAGLFCALQLARTGKVKPIVIERGQPVEVRGKDIGALMHRRSLDSESNFAFGEGGAGTWSDGKLTTRIGRNSEAVRSVLETFTTYGAPENILIEGAPHLGTDNLVRLLRNMRVHLKELGGQIMFGTKMTSLLMEDNFVVGVEYQRQENNSRRRDEIKKTSFGALKGDAVVLATGHSARDIYEQLNASGVQLEAKGFAVGFRVEHPQKLINKIQYDLEWGPAVVTGKKPTDVANLKYFQSLSERETNHNGILPVPSYRLATDKAYDGKFTTRGVYSFCMCPGGQIVPSSTDPQEVCVNGMSFSRRDSVWANSALVVTVSPEDYILDPYRMEHGVLSGLAFQRDMERRASILGGGNLTVPVQRLTDFMNGVPSTSAPPSSYRLGVRPAACHEIYPPPLVSALREALKEFDKRMPGFLCDDGLLHAVETRTSSPLRIPRDANSLQVLGVKNLYPAGEGAGFAGGIVSAAVDGMTVAQALLDCFEGRSRNDQKYEKSVDAYY